MKYEFDTEKMSEYELGHLQAILNCRKIELKPHKLFYQSSRPEHPYRAFVEVNYRIKDDARRKKLDGFIQKNYPIVDSTGKKIYAEDHLVNYTAPVACCKMTDSWYILYLKDARAFNGFMRFLEKEEFQPRLIHVNEKARMDEIGKETIKLKLERLVTEFDERHKEINKPSRHQRGYG